MTALAWKINRLRAMGLPEICHRVVQTARGVAERHGFGLALSTPDPGIATGKAWLQPLPHDFDTQPYREAAERILAGHFSIFALDNLTPGFPPHWNTDPRTGTQAPNTFGKAIDYRNENVVGDIKYLWEINRHLELVTLAQAAHLTGEARYTEACRTMLVSWLDQSPYPNGPGWISALENAVRLVNWSFSWQLLGGEQSPLFMGTDGQAFRRRWLDSIYQHCHFIAGHFSRHSSANNHLFGEYMGLFVAALTWPCWPQSRTWRDMAKSGLEQEALLQNAPDGVNREQGIWYHHEVADMMLLCSLIGRMNGIEFSHAYWDRLERMLEFIAALMDIGGNIPMIGDSDDAVMVRFSREPGFSVYRSLLASGAVLFGRPDFKEKADVFDDKSRWLLGDTADAQFSTLESRAQAPSAGQSFPDGGYYVFGCNLGSTDEVRIVSDAGPLGYLSIAAHGHADALNFTLSIGGIPILIDPGTYAYHTRKQWRDHFRGTAAHNTVRVDGVDQSLPGGNFLWLRHANTRCVSFSTSPEQDIWVAEHDGYCRLPDPVTHRRTITVDKTSRTIEVIDHLQCQTSHLVEINWQLSETCIADIQGHSVLIKNGGWMLELSMPGTQWVPVLLKGQDDPPAGWISYRFDEKVSAFCARWSGEISGTTVLVTQIKIDGIS